MRYFDPTKSITLNLKDEIELSIGDSRNQLNQLLNTEKHYSFYKEFSQSDNDLIAKTETIISYYVKNIHNIFESRYQSIDQTNAVGFGKYQLESGIDAFMVEGLKIHQPKIYSSPGYLTIESITIDCTIEDMKIHTFSFIYDSLQKDTIPHDEDRKYINGLREYTDQITRLLLFQAMEQLDKEGILKKYFGEKHIHFYYGETNSPYWSAYYHQ